MSRQRSTHPVVRFPAGAAILLWAAAACTERNTISEPSELPPSYTALVVDELTLRPSVDGRLNAGASHSYLVEAYYQRSEAERKAVPRARVKLELLAIDTATTNAKLVRWREGLVLVDSVVDLSLATGKHRFQGQLALPATSPFCGSLSELELTPLLYRNERLATGDSTRPAGAASYFYDVRYSYTVTGARAAGPCVIGLAPDLRQLVPPATMTARVGQPFWVLGRGFRVDTTRNIEREIRREVVFRCTDSRCPTGSVSASMLDRNRWDPSLPPPEAQKPTRHDFGGDNNYYKFIQSAGWVPVGAANGQVTVYPDAATRVEPAYGSDRKPEFALAGTIDFFEPNNRFGQSKTALVSEVDTAFHAFVAYNPSLTLVGDLAANPHGIRDPLGVLYGEGDWFQLTLPRALTVCVRLDLYEETQDNADLLVYNDAGALLGLSRGTGQDEFVRVGPLPAGTRLHIWVAPRPAEMRSPRLAYAYTAGDCNLKI